MRDRAPRSIGISLLAAVMVLGTPASAYALYGPIGLVLSGIGVFALLGLAAFLIHRWGDPEFRHRVGAVSLLAVTGGLLVALVSAPFAVRRDRLRSDAEVQRHCGARLDSLDPLDVSEPGSRQFELLVSEARAAGLPIPERLRPGTLSREPVAAAPDEWFEVTTHPVGARWVGWYEVEPELGRRFLLFTLRREPTRRADVLGLIERHELASGRWVRAVGDRIVVSRRDAGGTLELRDASLTVRATASWIGDAYELFEDGASGVYTVSFHLDDIRLCHLAADGRTRRLRMDRSRFIDVHSPVGDGFCVRAADGMVRIEGDPLRRITFDRATIARDNQPLLLALLGAMLSLLVAFLALRSRLRVDRALRRTPLVGRLRTLGLGQRVLIDERGDEHPIERIDAFVGFDPALETGDEPCVALGASSLAAGGGPYRSGRSRLVLRLVIAGTLDEARALARRRLLDRMSQVGLALLVAGAPCVLAALFLLFAS